MFSGVEAEFNGGVLRGSVVYTPAMSRSALATTVLAPLTRPALAVTTLAVTTLAMTVLALTAGCASPEEPASLGGPPLTADLVPLEGPVARFGAVRGELTIRIEPVGADAATWFIGGGTKDRESRLDVRREDGRVLFSPAPGRTVEIVRVGARPGATWESSGARIRFEGWERVETPAGVFDAARVRTQTLTAGYPEIETWWFAPGVGVVRYGQSKNVEASEMFEFSMQRLE